MAPLYDTCRGMNGMREKLQRETNVEYSNVYSGSPIPELAHSTLKWMPLVEEVITYAKLYSEFKRFLERSTFNFDNGLGNSDLYTAQLVSVSGNVNFRLYKHAGRITVNWCGVDPGHVWNLAEEEIKIAVLWASRQMKELSQWDKFNRMRDFLGGFAGLEKRESCIRADIFFHKSQTILAQKTVESEEATVAATLAASGLVRDQEAAKDLELAAVEALKDFNECSAELRSLQAQLRARKYARGLNEIVGENASDMYGDMARIDEVEKETRLLADKVDSVANEAMYCECRLERLTEVNRGMPDSIVRSSRKKVSLEAAAKAAVKVVGRLKKEKVEAEKRRGVLRNAAVNAMLVNTWFNVDL